MPIVLAIVAATGVLGLGLVAILLIGLRFRLRPVHLALFTLQKRFMNPRNLRTAGGPDSNWAVVEHIGRRSGREYRTPVGVIDHPEGVLVMLPYGPGTDWVRNVLAAGSAVVRHRGVTTPVTDPGVVGFDEAQEHLPPSERREAKMFGISDFLLLRRAG